MFRSVVTLRFWFGIQKSKYLLKYIDFKNKISIDLDSTIQPKEAQFISSTNEDLSSDSLRVLSLSFVPLSENDINSLRDLEDADDRLNYLLEGTVVFLGLIGSLDPFMQGVSDAIKTCHTAGVSVIMITGDQKPTACAITKSIGLIKESY